MTQPSKLLDNLDQQLKACTDRAERSRLVCRKAIHLARLDRLDDARAELAGLRSALANTLDPVSATWIMLAEGVAFFFSKDSQASLDRLKRAAGIARSAGLKSDGAVVDGWLAHVQLQLGSYDAAIGSLLSCIQEAQPDNHFAHIRASLSLAELHSFAGDLAGQRAWEQKARTHATSTGDEASIAALLLNGTANRVNWAAIEQAFGLTTTEDLASLRLELRSSLLFDSSFSDIGLSQQPKAMWGHLCMIDRNFSEAVAYLLPATCEGYFLADRTTATASLAVAYMHLGEMAEAGRFAAIAIQVLEDSSQTNDTVALAAARLETYYRRVGETERASALEVKAQSAFDRYIEERLKVRVLLERIPPP